MNKGDTPPRSIQDEEEYLQEEADIKEVEEELEDGEIEIEWDGSEAELVPDEDAEEFEDNFAGIKLSYVLKEDEIYDALRSSKSYRSAQKRLIAESIISCIMSGVFFAMFAIQMNWLTLIFAILCLILAAVIWPAAFPLHVVYIRSKQRINIVHRAVLDMILIPLNCLSQRFRNNIALFFVIVPNMVGYPFTRSFYSVSSNGKFPFSIDMMQTILRR